MRYSERANVQNVPLCVKCYRLFLCVEIKTLKSIRAAFCAVFSVSAAGVCVCVTACRHFLWFNTCATACCAGTAWVNVSCCQLHGRPQTVSSQNSSCRLSVNFYMRPWLFMSNSFGAPLAQAPTNEEYLQLNIAAFRCALQHGQKAVVFLQLQKVSIIFPSIISLLFLARDDITQHPSSSVSPSLSLVGELSVSLRVCVCFLQYDSYQISKRFTRGMLHV